MRHLPLLAAAFASLLVASPAPAQKPELVRKVTQLLQRQDHDRMVRELGELGPAVVPALLEVMRANAGDGAFNDMIGIGGGAGGRFLRGIYPKTRQDHLQADVQVPRPERNWGDLDDLSERSWSWLIHGARDWAECDEIAQRAAHMLGELPSLTAQHMGEVRKVYDLVSSDVLGQLCVSLGKVGRPAVPLLIEKAEAPAVWPLRGLYLAGPAASRELLLRLRQLDPKSGSWSHTAFWALLDRTEDPLLQRRAAREAERWISAGNPGTCLYIAGKLAKIWKGQPGRFVAAMREAEHSGRLTLVEAMARQDEGLSANTAVVLLGMIRDANRKYAPGMLCWCELKYGSPKGLQALGEELARILPGQPFPTTMVCLRIAKKLGKHAAPLRPWLEAHRQNASTRLAARAAEVLAAIDEGGAKLAPETRPGLLEAWREGEQRDGERFRKREYGQWRERLGDEISRKAALMELRTKDADWAWFLERELEELYVLPETPAIRLAPPPVPERLDHEGARRWLEESRILPEKPMDIHRALPAQPRQPAVRETTRLWLTQALARFVADGPWQGNWDPHKLVALMDADDPELRRVASETAAKFVDRGAAELRVDRLAFPIRHAELLAELTRGLDQHRWALRRALELGDEHQRLAAYLVLAASLRANPEQESAFSIRYALDDWQEGLALVAAEMLLVLPEGHALLEEFGWNDWLGFAAIARRKSPALAARKLQAVTDGAVPDWVRVRVEDWLLEHPLTRYALLQYLKKLGEHAKFIEPKLVALRKEEAASPKPDAALLKDIDAVLRAVK